MFSLQVGPNLKWKKRMEDKGSVYKKPGRNESEQLIGERIIQIDSWVETPQGRGRKGAPGRSMKSCNLITLVTLRKGEKTGGA